MEYILLSQTSVSLNQISGPLEFEIMGFDLFSTWVIPSYVIRNWRVAVSFVDDMRIAKIEYFITKTRLFKYTEHFNHQKMKIFR